MNCDQDCRASIAKGIAGMALILALLLMMGGCESSRSYNQGPSQEHLNNVAHNYCVNTLFLEPGTGDYANCRMWLSEIQMERQAQKAAAQEERRSRAWQNWTQNSLRVLGY